MEPQAEWITIKVLNWDKYNPRTDRKHHAWFRLENGIATEPKFHALSASHRFIAVCLFAEVSKRRGAPSAVNLPWLAASLKVRVSDILKTIDHLKKNQILTVETGNHPVLTGITTYERTNVTNDTNVHADEADASASGDRESASGGEATGRGARTTTELDPPPSPGPDFESAWKLYPRKDGKTEARDRFGRLIKSAADQASLLAAIGRFIDNHRARGTEDKFIPYMATFLGVKGKERWRDYLDLEAGTSLAGSPSSHIDWSKFEEGPSAAS